MARAVITADEVRVRADAIRNRIADAGGDPALVTVVAVTKGFGPDAVAAARAAGLVDIGENYAQELTAKANAVADGTETRWHFIGRLQRNKVRPLAPLVHLWQSIDRQSLIEEVARRAPGAAVLIQVDVTDDPGRGGCPPPDVGELVASCQERGLSVRGLMTVAPLLPPPTARESFTTVARLADRFELTERSMGMSADLEDAVAAGTTMVRIGSALFGERPR